MYLGFVNSDCGCEYLVKKQIKLNIPFNEYNSSVYKTKWPLVQGVVSYKYVTINV